MLRDLDAQELKYVDRDLLADRLERLQRERGAQRAQMEGVIRWAAEEYRKCIVSARRTVDGHHYEKVNGRAEAYRQLCSQIADVTGLEAPDWDAIREAVPPDGIYRKAGEAS